jgi:phosphoglycerol transferase MdoB-like AlkP superfamily enzyme
VAVDYLIFPHEVFVNIWDTYPVWQILLVDFLLTVALLALLRSRLSVGFAAPSPRRARLTFTGAVLASMVLLTWLVGPQLATVSQNRVVDQLALNGIYAFTEAALTNELDYDVYYARTNNLAAFGRVRALIAEPGVGFLQPPESLSIDRHISFPDPPRSLNVVIVLEESFGANFVKSLDSDGPGCTPEFEKLADKGLLFTNIYATGNRTVRGMEGLLLSFPPIPGQSIVRRPGGQHVFSLPALLGQEGYQTTFIYGGFSYFDNMGEFAKTNGFDRVIDRTDFTKKTFTTIWGVCDEDLFDNSLVILDSMYHSGRPFFSLILTVSNHSPYTYPEGRIKADPKEQRRENAVQYMDFSLGKFLRDAASHSFFDSTIFVVLGDHGARVYGSQTIPMRSYRIPVLMYAPSILKAGQRNPILGSQIDVAPTLMGILNLSYNSQFFGRDLLRLPPDSGVALMSHNRDVALLRGSRLGVLGLQQEEQLWEKKGAGTDITPAPITEDPVILEDAIAYFQSAYYLYKNHRLHPLEQPKRPGPAIVSARSGVTDSSVSAK